LGEGQIAEFVEDDEVHPRQMLGKSDRSNPSSRAALAASCPPMWQQNHASPGRGISKMKSQASRASDPKTLQSQTRPTTQKRLSFNGLEIVHGRLPSLGNLASASTQGHRLASAKTCGANASSKLTFQSDHSVGADQVCCAGL
jgi:hypothetical protein